MQRLGRGVICGFDEGLYRRRGNSDAASVRNEMTRQIPLSGVIARLIWRPNFNKLREVLAWTFSVSWTGLWWASLGCRAGIALFALPPYHLSAY